MRILDQNNWKRKEHFDFFSQFDEPYFGIVSEIDCTKGYKWSKGNNLPFFAFYLHKSLLAANKIEELRYRIDKDKIIIYDEIHASSTIARSDGTYGFSFIPYNTDFEIFNEVLRKEIAAVQNTGGLRFNKDAIRKDVIHYSSIPWSKFTGLTHARNFKINDSAPKITFGRIFSRGKKKIMPVSINVHHGLADGLHVAKFLELFQKLMENN